MPGDFGTIELQKDELKVYQVLKKDCNTLTKKIKKNIL